LLVSTASLADEPEFAARVSMARHPEQEKARRMTAGLFESWNSRFPVERFRAKRVPVRVKKNAQNKGLELPFRFDRNGKGSSGPG
jgi:hypothetical protein